MLYTVKIPTKNKKKKKLAGKFKNRQVNHVKVTVTDTNLLSNQ